ncbi:hypothetical protein AKO1_007003 [Acrasis kona]|uniref:Uncharacterized protein n=1 Tax=Acrasis kona TaxID=1008807 RepID=A0AAW2YUF9_9EUKA
MAFVASAFAASANTPCWTCPSGQIHWYDAGLSSAPGGDRCACVQRNTPTTTTNAPTITSPPNSIVVKNNKDVSFFSSPGGTSCSHSRTYNQVGQGRPSIIFSFSLSGVGSLTPGRSYAILDIRSTRCANANRIVSFVASANPSYDLVESSSSCTNNLQSNVIGNSTFLQDGSGCRLSRQIDVTAAIYAARSARKNVVTFVLSTSTVNDASNPNFCNRQVSPNVSPFFDSNNNCGVELNGREVVPSSFYLTLVNVGSGTTTTVAPTTTRAPETTTTKAPTSAPTTTRPPNCWTCPAGQTHWYDAGLTTAPGGDRCACVPDNNRGCWTCPPGYIHWFNAGLTSAPGGDRCACVRRSRTLAGRK